MNRYSNGQQSAEPDPAPDPDAAAAALWSAPGAPSLEPSTHRDDDQREIVLQLAAGVVEDGAGDDRLELAGRGGAVPRHQLDKPILLKRGMAVTIQEFLIGKPEGVL